MNWGKTAALALVASAILAGGGMYYAQEYAFYDRIADGQMGPLTLDTAAGPQPLTVTDADGIDSDSSPLRWRMCGTLTDAPADATPYDGATPLMAPGWFDCFDAAQIGADLTSGAARAYLSQANIRPDVDRILAIYPDGRVFGWHQYDEKNPERGVMD